jgi:hypothetical protein
MRVFVLVTLSILFTTVSSTSGHDFKTSELSFPFPEGFPDRRRLQPNLELTNYELPSSFDKIISIDSGAGTIKSTVRAIPAAKGGPDSDSENSPPGPPHHPPHPPNSSDPSDEEPDTEGENSAVGDSSSNDFPRSHESSEESTSTATASDASTGWWHSMSIYLKAAIGLFASFFFAGILLSIRYLFQKMYRPDALPMYSIVAPMHNSNDAAGITRNPEAEDSKLAGEKGGEVSMITRNHAHENSDTSRMLSSTAPAAATAAATSSTSGVKNNSRLNRGRNA